ncbi:MAG: ADP-ribose pyrophosphatase, partial [Clostridia bacterium]|nr:ADP-ribose pyrophosphatase [Clostridia bacterium]
MNLQETRLSGETKYEGHILTMQVDTVELPDGATATREVVRHPGGVCIAALTDRQELLFVRQFRYPYSQVLWELPAGKLSP